MRMSRVSSVVCPSDLRPRSVERRLGSIAYGAALLGKLRQQAHCLGVIFTAQLRTFAAATALQRLPRFIMTTQIMQFVEQREIEKTLGRRAGANRSQLFLDARHVIAFRRVTTQPGQRPRGLRQTRFQRQRSEEHTSELQSLMRTSYAAFCLK